MSRQLKEKVTPLWRLHGVCLDGSVRPRLRDITLELRTGVTAILGWSGSGKTSLLNLLVDYERPDAGTVDCRIPAAPGQLPLYWAPQEHGLWNHLTAERHMAAVTNGDGSLMRAGECLEMFGLGDQGSSFPDQMSVGQRSRLAVARALATNAMVFVMDEPLTHVDRERANIYWRRVIARVMNSDSSLIYATHSPEMVMGFAEHVAVIQEGKLTYSGDVDDLYWNPPSRALAFSLGPANWFTPSEAKLWLSDAEGLDRCVRPERLAVERNAQGLLRILDHHPGGVLTTIHVLHEPTDQEKTLHVVSVGPGIRPGDRIQITSVDAGMRLGKEAQ